MYHFTDGGLRNVWLKNGYVEKDTPYGKTVAFYDLDGLVTAICHALAHKQGKLTGAEFRYIRNALLMSQKSLGKLLGCSEQAVAKWEKFGRIPKAQEALMRLLFIEQKQGNRAVGAAVEMLNAIDRVSRSKIIVSESGDAWTSQIESQENRSEAEAEA